MPLQLKMHTAKSPKEFRCSGFGDCRRFFTRSEHLARHIRKHTGEKPFACIVPKCQRKFSRFDNMMQHTQTHRPKRRLGLSVEPTHVTGEDGLVSPISLSDEEDANERRLSIADLCNPLPKPREVRLTLDEFQALQALGQFGHTPVYNDSLRDLASTVCIEPSPDRRDALSS